MSTTDSTPSPDGDVSEQEQAVTPLELFFDLVFVFAFTQVSGFLAHNLTWSGMVRGAALLAVLWWAWVCYSWLTDAVPAEQWLPARLVVLTAMAAMLLVALAVPDAFGDDAVLFGVAYLVVRVLHIVFYAVAAPPETREAVLRVAPGFLGGPALLVVAGFVAGTLQAVLWTAAIAIDYGAVFIRGVTGFHVNVAHFVERHRLVVIIALGESLVAIGIGAAGLNLDGTVILAALLGITLVIALWWLYFDYIVLAAEERLESASDHERTILARDSYSTIHLSLVGGIIFLAVGIEQTLAHVGEPLGVVSSVALCGGSALYLFGHNAFRFRDHGTISVARLITALAACALIPVALRVPALGTIAALAVLFVVLATYETLRSEDRRRVRA